MVVRKIAFSGKANSGKNTVADIVSDHLKNYNCKIFAFAEPMKQIAKIMFPYIKNDWLYGESFLRSSIIEYALDENDLPLTCRKLLLDLGKLGRSYNQSTWINATISMMNAYLDFSSTNVVILADVRFKNEYKKLLENEFIVCRIIRPNSENKLINQDISEIDLDDIKDCEFDAVIINDGNKDDLKEQVVKLIDSLK